MQDRFRFRVMVDGDYSYFDMSSPDFAAEVSNICEYAHYTIFSKSEFCTGLKDKNGKLIYEGDEIRKGKTTYCIEWREAFCQYIYRQVGCQAVHDLCVDDANEYEIIGNIHENPELLK